MTDTDTLGKQTQTCLPNVLQHQHKHHIPPQKSNYLKYQFHKYRYAASVATILAAKSETPD